LANERALTPLEDETSVRKDSHDRKGTTMCPHNPPCPSADAADREAAHTIAFHPEQGWSLLCNGVVLFDDTGEILPDGRIVAPHRPTDFSLHHTAA
jgi:hypothetical protein